MTPSPTPDTDAGTLPQATGGRIGSAPAGSSVYGGRPTFALTSRDDADGRSVTLYELLPEAQSTARRERFRRRASNRRFVVELFETVFGDSTNPAVDRWDWTDWTAVKITRLSESRLRTILPLIRETLGGADVDASMMTAGGDSDAFVPEAAGVRLTLGFIGVKPIQRVDRMRALCRGVAAMSDEECYYWHAKCRAPSSPNGEKALRTLLTDHL